VIASASSIPLSQSWTGLPNVRTTLNGWFRPLTMTKIIKQQEDFQLKEYFYDVKTNGVLQPFSPQQLSIKPEGQRSWIWQMLHATPDLVLKTDDQVIITGTKYRVMEKLDYKEYGYVQYNLVQAYQGDMP